MPPAALAFLLSSRYCEVDSELMAFAWERFGPIAPGWRQVQAICDFVHEHIRFDYQHADRIGRPWKPSGRESASVAISPIWLLRYVAVLTFQPDM
jgi:transglutaminase-like putative cysteine protease